VSSPEELLSRRQRNDLYRAIEKSGAPIAEFRLSVLTTAARCISILHQPSNSYFLLSGKDSLFAEVGIQGDIGDPEDQVRARRLSNFLSVMGGIRGFCTWDKMLDLVEKWSTAVVKQTTEFARTPDLWADLDRAKQLLTAQYGNTPFSESEQAEISGQIRQLKAYIKATYELTAGQVAEVNDKFDQAERASQHMGRKDWLMLFNGAIFSLILTDLIPAQAAQNVLLMALQALGHLFGVGGPLPQIP
jgi:hypothetical protein